MNKIISVRGVGKVYSLPKGSLRVLDGIDFDLEAGELVAIMGMSGVGKTTFLNLLGLLDRPSEGTILLDGEDVFGRDEREKSRARNAKIGFVFQFFHLLPEFTVLENVGLPLFISGLEKRPALAKAANLLREVGLEDKTQFRPGLLSGGEQQRVAIARALVNDPKLLLADEPTGNLDWKTGLDILHLILDIHRTRGLSSILVTHNEKISELCQKVYLMENGRLKLLARP